MEKIINDISTDQKLSSHVLYQLVEMFNIDITNIETIVNDHDKSKTKLVSNSVIDSQFTDYIVEGRLEKAVKLLHKYENVKLSQSSLFTMCDGYNTCDNSLNGYINNICTTSDNDKDNVIYLIKYLTKDTVFKCKYDCFRKVHDYDDYFYTCIHSGKIKMATKLFLNFNVNSYNVLEMLSCYGDHNYNKFVNTFNIIKSCQKLLPEERKGVPILDDKQFMTNIPSPKIMEFYKLNT